MEQKNGIPEGKPVVGAIVLPRFRGDVLTAKASDILKYKKEILEKELKDANDRLLASPVETDPAGHAAAHKAIDTYTEYQKDISDPAKTEKQKITTCKMNFEGLQGIYVGLAKAETKPKPKKELEAQRKEFEQLMERCRALGG
jgi:hypothetical protein